MPLEIKVSVDNSDTIAAEFERKTLKALESCGLVAEGYAKVLVNSPGKHGTGNLRNSITHAVAPEEKAVYVGTDVDYGVYVEMGTGQYVPGGSPPWSYQDDQGNWHRTSGQPPRPFIKPSIADHGQEYRDIIQSTYQNG